MNLLVSKAHSDSPLALEGLARRNATLVSDFEDDFRFSTGGGYLVRCPVRCPYCYSVKSEELTTR